MALFARPIPATGQTNALDARDPLALACSGEVALERFSTECTAATDAVIGHFVTHLYLHELIRLPLSVARQLARHRGHLYLDKISHLTNAVAAALASHSGGGLSLNNLRHLSGSAARLLGRHPGVLSFNRIGRLGEVAALGLAQHADALYLWE